MLVLATRPSGKKSSISLMGEDSPSLAEAALGMFTLLQRLPRWRHCPSTVIRYGRFGGQGKAGCGRQAWNPPGYMKRVADSNFPGFPVPQRKLRTLRTQISRLLVEPASR
ncbi:hypothetical protein SCLCIDRAFT_335283 [Scleroderma citrinum Foug A]|uniref:Uncharacterized protein n=1 Tax=Scleroderma citrinum Foug A TaxID=1036808 RepID=A0A0C3DFT4_9AGAM|nr:hypothetical protein SCLCIDRAFT_335283 [Scleroderma citrinum Foug A]